MRGLRALLSAAAVLCAAVGVSAQETPAPPVPNLLTLGGGTPAGLDFALRAHLEPEAQAPGHPVVALVRFTCPQKWYIYADSVSVRLVPPEQAGALVEQGSLRLPESKSKHDALLGERVDYFDGQFEAALVLKIRADAPQGEHALKLRVQYQGCKPDLCFPPTERDVEVKLIVLAPGTEPVAVGELALPVRAEEFAERSLLILIPLAFVGGLLLALTPCVYPLIPVTIGVIGATTDRKLGALLRSLVYVLGISVTYAVLGLVAASAGEAFGTLLQSPVVYLAVAALLVVLAVSMFGLFEIQVPASWSARLQAKVHGRWGVAGIFVLGLLSGIAVTACVAPVISGALLYVFKSRDMLAGFLILFAIAWGMGTPLVVLGTFSGLIRSLPKSGKWQAGVRGLLGVALLVGAGFFVLKSGVLPSRDHLPGKWVSSQEQALREAGEQRKPVMIYFWQERCPSCDLLKARTFPDEGVLAEQDRFVCAAIDGTRWDARQRSEMREKYGVWGFPTIAFIDSRGQVLKERTIVGYVNAERLLEVMQGVR